MKIAYIDHSYHKRTKSTAFLSDILIKKGFDVEFVWDLSWCGGTPVNFDELLGKYDAYIFFQIYPQSSIPFHQTGANITFIPMLDSNRMESMFQHTHTWDIFNGFKVLCFSQYLTNAFLSNGVAARFFQYYPNADDYSVNYNFNNINSFFWIRCPDMVNWRMVKQVLKMADVHSTHIHLTVDPGKEVDIIPPEDVDRFNITTSDWFDNRDEYMKRVQNSHLYFAPRSSEGIGMSFLEAMAMGKCVVAMNNGTMNEYITSGLNGVLYDVDHKGNVKLIPESLSLNSDNIRKMCQNARQSIELGYQHWKTRETSIVDFIAANPKSVYEMDFQIPFHRNRIFPKRKITFWTLIMNVLPYGIVRWYIKRKYGSELGENP